MTETDLLTPREAARLLGVHYDSVLSYIASGALPALDFTRGRGGRATYRIRRVDLEEFLTPKLEGQ